VVDVGPLAPSVVCDRCNQPADADRIDISTYGDRPGNRWIWGWITCTTPGCVDETGSPTVEPPDEPGQLTREDRRWIRRHRKLAEELAWAERALMEAT